MEVSYSYQGQSKKQNIMSFANPAVYAAIKTFAEGDQLEVEVGKNEAGYNTWASVKKSGGAVLGTGTAEGGVVNNKAAPAARSTYETAEERAKKQVYIIKQSCLAQSVAYGESYKYDVETVLATAQQFVDWVLEDGTQEGQPQD